MKKTIFWTVLLLLAATAGIHAQTPTVYVAGAYQSGDTRGACYWKNGERHVLPGGAGATKIAVANGKVYVAGYFDDDNGKSRPCYWVDGVKREISPLGWYATTLVTAIAVLDGKVYIAGRYTNNNKRTYSNKDFYGCYWIDGITRNDIHGGNYRYNDCIDMVIEDDMIYFLSSVSYTVLGQDVALEGWKSASDMTVVNGNVFVSGNGGANAPYRPCYWLNGTRIDLQFSNTDVAASTAEGIAVAANGTVCIITNKDSTTGKRCFIYYRVPGDSNAYPWFELTGSVAGASHRAVTISNESAYIAGTYMQGPIERACYWVFGQNPVRHALPGGHNC